MLPPSQAESLILKLVRPLNPQQDGQEVGLHEALGRILACSAASSLDFPHWDNSAMDGYAVRYQDVQSCPVTLDIGETIPAGNPPQQTLRPGQCARIFTGAMLPPGADTIVIQENTHREGDRVRILAVPQGGDYVRRRGSFYQRGNPLLAAGIRLQAPDLAVLAAAQCHQLTVYRRPRVAIFSTGDELVPPEQPLQPGQIVDSNQYALAAFVAERGAMPLKLGIVPDRPEALKSTISEAIQSADLVLSTGGVSVGDYDYVESVLSELGGQIHLSSVAIRPGKPLSVATFGNGCLYFGIPGNPVSALVSCWRFVAPALAKLSGLAGNWSPKFAIAKTNDLLRGSGDREVYLWGQLQLVAGNYEFNLAPGSHSSGNMVNLAQTTGLAVVPAGQGPIPAGSPVQVMVIAA
ncbi:MAG: molybdopterin molybdotransferase MoeA [Chloroflexaceae bacterium]|nr:molybdopterin molybdotransferase MoeA [Chloroflexaceae bacterium]